MEVDTTQPALAAARALAGKRILVTGATGMVGATLVRALLAGGARVHALAREDSSFWRIAEVAAEIEIHMGDLTDPASLAGAIAAKPEVIYHVATTRANHLAASRVNVDGLRNLLESTLPLDYERFIVVSSSLVCGKHDKPLDEECELNPVDFFGKSKAAAETLAREFARATGKPIAVMRPFSVYGDWESPSRLIPTAILAALSGSPIRLTAPGLRRDLVFVHDVAQALCLAGGSVGIAPGEVINVGTGVQTANEEIIQLIEEACGRTIPVVGPEYPPRSTDTTHWVADPSKAKRMLGWKAHTNARDGIRRTVEWIRAHLDVYERARFSGISAIVAEIAAS